MSQVLLAAQVVPLQVGGQPLHRIVVVLTQFEIFVVVELALALVPYISEPFVGLGDVRSAVSLADGSVTVGLRSSDPVLSRNSLDGYC